MKTQRIIIASSIQSQRKTFKEVLEFEFPSIKIHLADNGLHSLAIIKKNDDKNFHLVIADVSMPQMGGLVLAELVYQQYPQLPFILVHGGQFQVDFTNLSTCNIHSVFEFPPDYNYLVRTVNKAIATSKGK